MIDIASILLNPIFLSVIAIACGIGAVLIYQPGGKKEEIYLLERLRAHEAVLHVAKMIPKNGQVQMKDGRKFIIPNTRIGTFERVWIAAKKKFTKWWMIENGEITYLNDTLSGPANPVLDNATVQVMENRKGLKDLATSPTTASQFLIYIILGLAVGFMIAYILYPQINHPAPNLVFCRQLANGTMIPRNVCPQ